MKPRREPQTRTLVILASPRNDETLDVLDEEPVLVFPEIAGTMDPELMKCWTEAESHGDCHIDWIRDRTRCRVVTDPEEMNTYLPLMRMYERLYNLPVDTLTPAYRMSYRDYRRRVTEIDGYRKNAHERIQELVANTQESV